jgi:hypothetical protein
MSIPALGPTQPPVQWVPGVLNPGQKRGRGVNADHSPPSIADLRMSMSYNPLPLAPSWRVVGEL